MHAVREIVETILFALLIFLLIQAVWRNFRVEGHSMEPNIHDGQYLIVERLPYSTGFPVNLLRRTLGRLPLGNQALSYVYHPPQRGDVVVFIPPNNQKKDYIKRVIGIAGDRVELRQGTVYVNGYPLNEPYTMPGQGPASTWGPSLVGKDELFVLGDNRGASTDSRFFGMLPAKDVIGKAWLSYWPPRHWGFLRHVNLKAQLQAVR